MDQGRHSGMLSKGENRGTEEENQIEKKDETFPGIKV